MKERSKVSFRVSKYSIRMYMRKRRILKAIRRAFDRFCSCLSESERRDVAEEFGFEQ